MANWLLPRSKQNSWLVLTSYLIQDLIKRLPSYHATNFQDPYHALKLPEDTITVSVLRVTSAVLPLIKNTKSFYLFSFKINCSPLYNLIPYLRKKQSWIFFVFWFCLAIHFHSVFKTTGGFQLAQAEAFTCPVSTDLRGGGGLKRGRNTN